MYVCIHMHIGIYVWGEIHTYICMYVSPPSADKETVYSIPTNLTGLVGEANVQQIVQM